VNYKEESLVTIGIGALCTTDYGILNPSLIRPDAMILMADTLGSTDTDSTESLHKLFVGHDLFAVSADNVQVAAEVFTATDERLAALNEPRTHGSIWRTLSEVATGVRAERFRAEVIATKYNYMLPNPLMLPPPEHARMMEEFREYPLGCQMVVGAFDQNGMALLYFIGNFENKFGIVHGIQFPGFMSIGAGYHNATMWLNYRSQRLGMNIKQSALHVYESMRFASSAPSVNEHIDALVATKGWHQEFSTRKDAALGSPISLRELRGLAKKFGPRATRSLATKAGVPLNPQSPKDGS
jgi:hypothetical protein